MFESLGYQVLKLKREKYANLDLKGLKPGEYRKLSNKEIAVFYKMGATSSYIFKKNGSNDKIINKKTYKVIFNFIGFIMYIFKRNIFLIKIVL